MYGIHYKTFGCYLAKKNVYYSNQILVISTKVYFNQDKLFYFFFFVNLMAQSQFGWLVSDQMFCYIPTKQFSQCAQLTLRVLWCSPPGFKVKKFPNFIHIIWNEILKNWANRLEKTGQFHWMGFELTEVPIRQKRNAITVTEY